MLVFGRGLGWFGLVWAGSIVYAGYSGPLLALLGIRCSVGVVIYGPFLVPFLSLSCPFLVPLVC